MNSLKISLVGLPEVPQIKFLPTNDIERNIKGNPIWVSLHKGHPEKRLHSQPTPRTRAPNSWHFSKQTIHFGDSLLFLILFFFFFFLYLQPWSRKSNTIGSFWNRLSWNSSTFPQPQTERAPRGSHSYPSEKCCFSPLTPSGAFFLFKKKDCF